MEIIQDDYQVLYNSETTTITCIGTFRLRGPEYAPIVQLMTEVADAKPEQITLDLRNLQFLNSSGINTLSKFVIQVRRHGVSHLLVRGSNDHPWQRKSLKNFQRLKSDLELELE
jgi:hypothetical protein